MRLSVLPSSVRSMTDTNDNQVPQYENTAEPVPTTGQPTPAAPQSGQLPQQGQATQQAPAQPQAPAPQGQPTQQQGQQGQMPQQQGQGQQAPQPSAPQGGAQETLGASSQEVQDDSGLQRDPDTWVTGDEPMTAAQKSYLDTLAKENGEELPADLTKAEASKHIERLQQGSNRVQ